MTATPLRCRWRGTMSLFVSQPSAATPSAHQPHRAPLPRHRVRHHRVRHRSRTTQVIRSQAANYRAHAAPSAAACCCCCCCCPAGASAAASAAAAAPCSLGPATRRYTCRHVLPPLRATFWPSSVPCSRAAGSRFLRSQQSSSGSSSRLWEHFNPAVASAEPHLQQQLRRRVVLLLLLAHALKQRVRLQLVALRDRRSMAGAWSLLEVDQAHEWRA